MTLTFGTFSLHCKSEGLFRELEKAPENWKAPSENRKAFYGNQKASSKEVHGRLLVKSTGFVHTQVFETAQLHLWIFWSDTFDFWNFACSSDAAQ